MIAFRRHGLKRHGKYAGNGVIGDNQTGLVAVLDSNGNRVPVRREIKLIDPITNLVIERQWSDEQGRYQFKYLNENMRYDVYARDYLKNGTNNYAIIGHSDVTPEVI